ncbi:hypothetical protein MHBO_001766 [Bonamia ostreae]|uniref:Uncharacterized protein n=1 Tax=Bonamia ostreae TaxID=126728 RepID=A0ABV2AK43_9EUKA
MPSVMRILASEKYLMVALEPTTVEIILLTPNYFRPNPLTAKSDIRKSYDPRNFNSMEDVLETFFGETSVGTNDVKMYVVISFHGPTEGNAKFVKFSDWNLNADTICKKFDIEEVFICNKTKLISHSLTANGNKSILSNFIDLNMGSTRNPDAVSIVIEFEPMTFMYVVKDAIESECDHIEFEPLNQEEVQINSFFKEFLDVQKVDIGDVLSRKGLDIIYAYCCEKNLGAVNNEISERVSNSKIPGKVICELAFEKEDEICEIAVETFTEILASQIGNMAMQFFPFGGIFIVGDFIPEFMKQVDVKVFRESFKDKDKSNLLTLIPFFLQKLDGRV